MCKCFYCTFGTSASIEYLITVLLLHIWCKFFYCIKCANCTFGSSVAIALNVQVFLLQRPHHPSSPFPSDCTRLATFIRDQNHQNTPTSVLSSKTPQFFDTFSRFTQILYRCRIYQLSSEQRDIFRYTIVHLVHPSTPQYTLVYWKMRDGKNIDLYSAHGKMWLWKSGEANRVELGRGQVAAFPLTSRPRYFTVTGKSDFSNPKIEYLPSTVYTYSHIA